MLSDEERKAIKEVKHFNQLTRYWQEEYEEKEIAEYIKTILNLIEKQSKEIEEYKKQLDLDYVKNNYTSNDKIKAKIEELDKAYEDSKDENGESEYYYPDYTVRVLQSLLEKE